MRTLQLCGCCVVYQRAGTVVAAWMQPISVRHEIFQTVQAAL